MCTELALQRLNEKVAERLFAKHNSVTSLEAANKYYKLVTDSGKYWPNFLAGIGYNDEYMILFVKEDSYIIKFPVKQIAYQNLIKQEYGCECKMLKLKTNHDNNTSSTELSE